MFDVISGEGSKICDVSHSHSPSSRSIIDASITDVDADTAVLHCDRPARRVSLLAFLLFVHTPLSHLTLPPLPRFPLSMMKMKKMIFLLL